MKENKEGKLFGECLVGRERWENDGVFFLNPPFFFFGLDVISFSGHDFYYF